MSSHHMCFECNRFARYICECCGRRYCGRVCQNIGWLRDFHDRDGIDEEFVGVSIDSELWEASIKLSEEDIAKYIDPEVAMAFKGIEVRVCERGRREACRQYFPVITTQYGVLLSLAQKPGLSPVEEKTMPILETLNFNVAKRILHGPAYSYIARTQLEHPEGMTTASKRKRRMAIEGRPTHATSATATTTSSTAGRSTVATRGDVFALPLVPLDDSALIVLRMATGNFQNPYQAHIDLTEKGIEVSDLARDIARSYSQNKPAWKNLRRAFVTASEIGKVTGLGYKSWYQWFYKKVEGPQPAEMVEKFEDDVRFLGKRELDVTIKSRRAMDFGSINESVALMAYAIMFGAGKPTSRTGLTISRVKGEEYFAGSPDLVVGDDGLAESKISATDERYLQYQMPQVQALLHVMQREWLDLIFTHMPLNLEEAEMKGESYVYCDHPRAFDDRSVMTVIRVTRSDAYWDKLSSVASQYVKAVLQRISEGEAGKSKGPPTFDILSWSKMEADFPVWKLASKPKQMGSPIRRAYDRDQDLMNRARDDALAREEELRPLKK
jgi:hypothetical protein